MNPITPELLEQFGIELPANLQEIADVIGIKALCDLLEEYGYEGEIAYVPEKFKPGSKHPIIQAIGEEAAHALARVYGKEEHVSLGGFMRVRNAVRAGLIRAERDAGATLGAIARKHKIGRRSVELILNRSNRTATRLNRKRRKRRTKHP